MTTMALLTDSTGATAFFLSARPCRLCCSARRTGAEGGNSRWVGAGPPCYLRCLTFVALFRVPNVSIYGLILDRIYGALILRARYRPTAHNALGDTPPLTSRLVDAFSRRGSWGSELCCDSAPRKTACASHSPSLSLPPVREIANERSIPTRQKSRAHFSTRNVQFPLSRAKQLCVKNSDNAARG